MRVKPNLPETMLRKIPRGQCRWCGEPILNPDGKPDTRLNWHPRCVEVFKIATWSNAAREAVFKRDAGKCAACGLDCAALERARWLAWRENRLDLLSALKLSHPKLSSGAYWHCDHVAPV